MSTYFLCFLVPRENGRHAKFVTPPTRKPLFSRCALAPAPRATRRKTENYTKPVLTKFRKFCVFLLWSSRQGLQQKTPKMTARNPSGTLPGRLRECQIDQLAVQGRPFGLPEPLRDGSGEALEIGWAPKGRPEARAVSSKARCPEASWRP